MVAKIIVVAVAFWAVFALMTWAAFKYGLPEYLAYKQEVQEKQHEREMKQLERDEKLVEEAEDEYWNR